jgi:starch-binding outer membrane protein, SusD/RagB family
LDMKTEIRRERAVELYREGKRFDDLKRWGILEEALNPSRLGMVVGDGATYATDFKDASGNPTASYKASSYVFGEEAVQTPSGELKCVVVDSKTNHSVQKKHYLNPISQDQLNLNSNLKQNPGY